MPSCQTKHFGLVEYEEYAAFRFPAGLPGFEQEQRFLPLRQAGFEPLVFLQRPESREPFRRGGMLIIRRRAGESLPVGETVEIQVLEVSPSRVTLGIVAPREVQVMRSEVKLTREQNRAAAQLPSTAPLARLAEALKLGR